MTNVKVDYSVTLKALRRAGACYSGYNRVVRSLQGLPFTARVGGCESYIRYVNNGYRISLLFVLESNGFDDALWTLRCIDSVERDARLYAVWCARQVQHLMTDNRSIAALDAAERYANGQATDDEIDAARTAAIDAAWDAKRGSAIDAASTAAWAAARAAASTAVRAAVRAAAWDAARAAARAAAWAAASTAAWDSQKEMFVLMINGEAPWQQ